MEKKTTTMMIQGEVKDKTEPNRPNEKVRARRVKVTSGQAIDDGTIKMNEFRRRTEDRSKRFIPAGSARRRSKQQGKRYDSQEEMDNRRGSDSKRRCWMAEGGYRIGTAMNRMEKKGDNNQAASRCAAIRESRRSMINKKESPEMGREEKNVAMTTIVGEKQRKFGVRHLRFKKRRCLIRLLLRDSQHEKVLVRDRSKRLGSDLRDDHV